MNSEGGHHLDGKVVPFSDVQHFFIFGLDESGFQANGKVEKITGEKGKKKHEKRLADSRVSVTAVRVGSIAGHNGPTALLAAGKVCLCFNVALMFLGCAVVAAATVV